MIAGTLVAALLLAMVYLLGDRFVAWQRKHPRRSLSVAAGVAMAYVFMDVLPELSARHGAFLEVAGEVPFAEFRIYTLALFGFVVLYGLDQLVRRTPEGEPHTGPVVRLHMGGYALYGAVIGDALVSRAQKGPVALWLYAVAMAFHLLLIASSLAREHGRPYRERGRWILAASLLAGWVMAVFAPLSETTMARLFAFVAGGVLMTSANEELPRRKEGSFGWFATGAAVYGSLLLLT